MSWRRSKAYTTANSSHLAEFAPRNLRGISICRIKNKSNNAALFQRRSSKSRNTIARKTTTIVTLNEIALKLELGLARIDELSGFIVFVPPNPAGAVDRSSECLHRCQGHSRALKKEVVR